MKQEIEDYTLAIEEHIEATQAEYKAKLRLQKTRYKVLQAKQAMRAKEWELMELK